MKKIVLMMLVAMVPFMTMAQKRSKKNKNAKIEKIEVSNSSVEYMVVKGVEYPANSKRINSNEERLSRENEGMGEEELLDIQRNMRQNLKSIFIITLDFGKESTKESRELIDQSIHYSSMAEAANAAAERGWEFVSANVVPNNGNTTHYYYMKRNK
jgi:TolA-binding protein